MNGPEFPIHILVSFSAVFGTLGVTESRFWRVSVSNCRTGPVALLMPPHDLI